MIISTYIYQCYWIKCLLIRVFRDALKCYLDFKCIKDKNTLEILTNEYNNILTAYENGIYTYTYYGIISIVEALLIYVLKKYNEETYNICKRIISKPEIHEKDISRWELWILLKISCEMGIITSILYDVFMKAKDERNNIHLWQLIRKKRVPKYAKNKIYYLLQYLSEMVKTINFYIENN